MWYDDMMTRPFHAPIAPQGNHYCPQCGHLSDDHDDWACNFRWLGSHWEPDTEPSNTVFGE